MGMTALMLVLAIGRIEHLPAATPTPAPLRLVLHDGRTLPVRAWRVRGALVVAEAADGTAVSLRAARVDLEASARAAARSTPAPPAERPPDATRGVGHRPGPRSRRPGSLSVASGSAGRHAAGVVEAGPAPARPAAAALVDAEWGARVDLAFRRLERARLRHQARRESVERLEQSLAVAVIETAERRARESRIEAERLVLAEARRELDFAERAFRERAEQARRAGASFSVWRLR